MHVINLVLTTVIQGENLQRMVPVNNHRQLTLLMSATYKNKAL